MPYSIRVVKGGEKVVSPNHPHGFSKKPQSHEMAMRQERAILANSHEDIHGKKKIGIKKK